jgi:hypothetical protein
MGRHSSPEQGPFYRSIIGWLLPWFMIAVVVLVAVWVAVDAVGGDDLDATPVARETEPAVEETTPAVEETPTEEPTPEQTPKPERTPKEDKVALITKGITVQVLNGTGVSDADDRMAERLGDLGYEVVAIEGSSKQYGSTTVFWSFPEARDAAEALAERFGWIAQLKPANLSSTVDLHIVVGSDEA